MADGHGLKNRGNSMEGRELVAFSAALIAALLSIAKLIADKESKISEFRKDWINSFRAALSEMLGEAHAISGRIKIRIRHAEAAKGLKSQSVTMPAREETGALEPEQHDFAAPTGVDNQLPSPSSAGSITSADGQSAESATFSDRVDPALLTDEEIAELEEKLTDHWNTLRKAHRTVLLHMNFSETAWGGFPYEQSISPEVKAAAAWTRLQVSSPLARGLAVASPYDATQNGKPSEASTLLVAELDKLVTHLLGKYYEVGTDKRYDVIKRSIEDATLLGNLVLKPEWNRIKRGEDRYNQLLLVLGAVFLFGSGALALFAFAPRKPASTPAAVSIQLPLDHQDSTSACSTPVMARPTWARHSLGFESPLTNCAPTILNQDGVEKERPVDQADDQSTQSRSN